jgi:hypothetical protein
MGPLQRMGQSEWNWPAENFVVSHDANSHTYTYSNSDAYSQADTTTQANASSQAYTNNQAKADTQG